MDMKYKVSATISGHRIVTDKTFAKKTTAQAYADATNKFRHGARAVVVKAKR
jgi:hypothetical protein